MSIEVFELNTSPCSLEVNHEEGTASFTSGDYSLNEISIETIIEASEILRKVL